MIDLTVFVSCVVELTIDMTITCQSFFIKIQYYQCFSMST